MRAETAREEKEDQEKQMGLEGNNLSNQNIKKKKTKKQKKRRYYFIPRFGCMRLDDGVPAAGQPDAAGGFDVEAGCNGRNHLPTHLVVMVNGIIGRFENSNGYISSVSIPSFLLTDHNRIIYFCDWLFFNLHVFAVLKIGGMLRSNS